MKNRLRYCVMPLTLLITAHGNVLAQESDCNVQLKVSPRGVPTVTENRRSMMQSVGRYSYRLDALSDEMKCINVDFDFVLRFTNRDGKPELATYPGSLRMRNGKASDYGDLPGHRNDTGTAISIENIVCKRC